MNVFLLYVKRDYDDGGDYRCCVKTKDLRKFLRENLNSILLDNSFYSCLNFFCSLAWKHFCVEISKTDYFEQSEDL